MACYTTCVYSGHGTRKRKGALDVLLVADAFNGLTEPESYIVCSNLYTIGDDEWETCFGEVDPKIMREVDHVLRIVLDLP